MQSHQVLYTVHSAYKQYGVYNKAKEKHVLTSYSFVTNESAYTQTFILFLNCYLFIFNEIKFTILPLTKNLFDMSFQ